MPTRTPAPTALAPVWDAIDDAFDEYVDELVELSRFRSRREEADGMLATAAWIEDRLQRLGAGVEVVESAGAYPYVLGTIGDGPRSLLHFNHYDVEVEPPGPDAAWTAPPFEPTIRDGRLYARGIADDKAALLSRMHAVDALRRAGVELPLQVRFLFEGKRTLGAPALGDIVEGREDWFRADGALWENSWTDFDGRPLLKLGEKGILYLELRARGLERDLSSQNAAMLPQAASLVARAVGALTEHVDGRHVPGFLDAAHAWDDEARRALAELPYDREWLVQRAGEGVRARVEAEDAPGVTVRTVPTIVLSWMHVGPPPGSVALGVPAEARAGVELRLVPGQSTAGTLAAVEAFLASRGLLDGLEIIVLRAGEPELTPSTDPFVQLVAETAGPAYGHPPMFESTTIWIGTRALVSALGVPVVGVGIGRPDSSIDGPDENIVVEDYRMALRHLTAIMLGMGEA